MTVTDCNTATDRDEARRVEAVRRFQADQGRFPGALDVLRRSRLAEIEADDLAEEAAVGACSTGVQGTREPAPAEL